MPYVNPNCFVLSNAVTASTTSTVTITLPDSSVLNLHEGKMYHRFINITEHATSTANNLDYVNYGVVGTGTAGTFSLGSGDFIRVCNIDIGSVTVQRDLNGLYYSSQLVEREIKKQRLKNNLTIRVNYRQIPLRSYSPAEEKARNTLRDLLTEADWRRYMTNGFVMVKGLQYWYQIFAGSGVNVFHEGKKINSICIHTDDSCPPSDHVLNMMSLIEFDEMAIWRFGNVKTPDGHFLRQARKDRILV